MNTWWEEIKNGSHRDQLSCSYAIWKNQDIKIKYLDKNIFDCKWFKWNCAHKKPNFLLSKLNTKPMLEKQEKKIVDIQFKIVNNKSEIKNKPVISLNNKKSNLKTKIKEIKVVKSKKEPLKNSSMNDY